MKNIENIIVILYLKKLTAILEEVQLGERYTQKIS